jgi:hypothetical protein
MSPDNAPTKRRSGGSSAKPKSSSSSRSTRSKSSNSKPKSGGTATRTRSSASRTRSQTTRRATAQSNGTGEAVKEKAGNVAEAGQNAAKSVLVPVATATVAAAAGVVGGVLLGRTKLTRKRKVLGVPVPGTGKGLDGFARQVGEAGKQLGNLATEVREAREKAEQVGKALS